MFLLFSIIKSHFINLANTLKYKTLNSGTVKGDLNRLQGWDGVRENFCRDRMEIGTNSAVTSRNGNIT